MAQCRHCRKIVTIGHWCEAAGRWIEAPDVNRIADHDFIFAPAGVAPSSAKDKDDTNFGVSVLAGMATDNPMAGVILGGSIAGSMLGAAMTDAAADSSSSSDFGGGGGAGGGD